MKLLKSKILCSMLALFVLFTSAATAASSQSWYCKRQKNHVRPTIDPQMSFVTENGGVFLGKDPDEKVIYLTFDAGYENGNVERILDVLKKHNAPGAFFVLDNLIKRNTELIIRMAEEGHLVCNHTAHHKDMTKLSDVEFEAELSELEQVYKEKTGHDMAKFYRPPEGKFNEQNLACAKRLGYTTVFWSLAYADWDNNKQPSPDYAKKLLCDNIHNGAVVLLHPTSKTNADILDELLTIWESEGYRFGSLNDFSENA